MNTMAVIEPLTLTEADKRLTAELSCEFSAAYGYRTTPQEEAVQIDPMLDAGHRVTALWRDSAAIGAAIWMDMGDHVFIRRFWLTAAVRGQGLGRVFFQRLVNDVFPHSRQVRLEVRDDGPKGFWTDLGFKETSIGMHLTRSEA